MLPSADNINLQVRLGLACSEQSESSQLAASSSACFFSGATQQEFSGLVAAASAPGHTLKQAFSPLSIAIQSTDETACSFSQWAHEINALDENSLYFLQKSELEKSWSSFTEPQTAHRLPFNDLPILGWDDGEVLDCADASCSLENAAFPDQQPRKRNVSLSEVVPASFPLLSKFFPREHCENQTASGFNTFNYTNTEQNTASVDKKKRSNSSTPMLGCFFQEEVENYFGKEHAVANTNKKEQARQRNNNPKKAAFTENVALPFAYDTEDAGIYDNRHLLQPYAKPNISYASLITQAVKASKKNKMTLNEIYEWIKNAYPYFRCTDSSWQNSIRHNLSLNKCFKKIPRPSDEPGKGGFWSIDEQVMEYQRTKNISSIGRRSSFSEREACSAGSSRGSSSRRTSVTSSIPMEQPEEIDTIDYNSNIKKKQQVASNVVLTNPMLDDFLYFD